MEKAVVWFSEGTKEQKALLGGKGANLAEMTNLGLPVPQGFIVPATICLTYLEEQVLKKGGRYKSPSLFQLSPLKWSFWCNQFKIGTVWICKVGNSCPEAAF